MTHTPQENDAMSKTFPGRPDFRDNSSRIEIEIVEALLDSILADGKTISVSAERGYDVDEMLQASTDKEDILQHVFNLDECHLFVHKAGKPAIKRGQVDCIGWVFLVLGNREACISDYSVNIESLVTKAEGVADSYL